MVKTAKRETCIEGALKRRTRRLTLGREVRKGLWEEVTIKTETRKVRMN